MKRFAWFLLAGLAAAVTPASAQMSEAMAGLPPKTRLEAELQKVGQVLVQTRRPLLQLGNAETLNVESIEIRHDGASTTGLLLTLTDTKPKYPMPPQAAYVDKDEVGVIVAALQAIKQAGAAAAGSGPRAEPFINTKSGLTLRLVGDPGIDPYFSIRLAVSVPIAVNLALRDIDKLAATLQAAP